MHGRRTLLKFIFGRSKIETQPPDNLYNEESFRQSRRSKVTIKSSPRLARQLTEPRWAMHGPASLFLSPLRTPIPLGSLPSPRDRTHLPCGSRSYPSTSSRSGSATA